MKILLIIDVLLIFYRLFRNRIIKQRMSYDLEYTINYYNSKISDIDAILCMLMYLLIVVTIIIGIIKIF